LRAEREVAGIFAIDVAAVWGCHSSVITQLETRASVDPVRVRHYRRTLAALAKQRQTARRQLIRELGGR
jgi:hypothetical protein